MFLAAPETRKRLAESISYALKKYKKGMNLDKSIVKIVKLFEED